ncbi:MAG: flagellar FliJ protein [Alphaproteobacteria bacterium]
MKPLFTLIRLKQEQLDEKRLVLTRLETEVATINSMIENLDIEVACESEAARGDAKSSFGYGSYIAAARARRTGLEARLDQVGEKIEVAADEVADAFREMKRFELAQSFADQREAADAARREQILMDDVGMTGYRRARAPNGS